MTTTRAFCTHLHRQLDFIDASCKRFDQGAHHEAIRIAQAVRVLFHTTAASTSLITHLGIAPEMASYCYPIFDKTKFFPNLTVMVVSLSPPSFDFHPKLDAANQPRGVTFDEWWNVETVYNQPPDVVVTRKSLVLAAANKDGGAHIDRPTAQYQAMIDGLGCSIILTPPDRPEIPFTSELAHFSAIRQIGHEVLKSSSLTSLLTSADSKGT